jgi:hypothetical protein
MHHSTLHSEVDPLLCPQCPNLEPVEMRLVSVIQAPTVIDGILGHLQRIGGNDPHEGTAQRGPPVGWGSPDRHRRLSTNARMRGRWVWWGATSGVDARRRCVGRPKGRAMAGIRSGVAAV